MALGHWCESLLAHDAFTLVRTQFGQQCFEHWASTDPKNLKEREFIFTKARALQDFVGHLEAYVAQKDKLTALSDDNEDAQMETD